jgi:hypothetical protein
MSEIRRWLAALALDRFFEAIEENDTDMSLLAQVNDQVLKNNSCHARWSSSTLDKRDLRDRTLASYNEFRGLRRMRTVARNEFDAPDF